MSITTSSNTPVLGPPAWAGYVLALPLVALATLLASVADSSISVPNVSLIFVLPVVILAVAWGWGPALLAAGAGVLCYNFFLIAPRYTLRVADPANVWALALFMVVAAIVSAVAAGARRGALEARTHAGQGVALQSLGRNLVAASGREAIATAAAETLAELFEAPAFVMVADGEDRELTASAPGVRLDAADAEAGRWAMASQLATRAGAYPVDAARFDCWPVRTGGSERAVLAVAFAEGRRGRPADADRLASIVGGYLAVALERDLYAAEALDAQLGRAREEIKADLLAAVSHDLKTPLATVLFSLQSLQRFGDGHDDATRAELLALAETETAKLGVLVGNLLDMNRLEAGAVVVHPAPAALPDLVTAAVRRAAAALAGHTVHNRTVGDASVVQVDFALAETALAAALENAGKYAPAGTPVEIRSGTDGPFAVVEVLDGGPGFPPSVDHLFEKFTRGVQGDGRPPGTGLGLAIARGFLRAMGGSIAAANREDGSGGKVEIRIPLAHDLVTGTARAAAEA